MQFESIDSGSAEVKKCFEIKCLREIVPVCVKNSKMHFIVF